MKKSFLFKESDLKEMAKNLTVQWLYDESMILAIAIKFFEALAENPERYGVTDSKNGGSDGNLLFYMYHRQLVVGGKFIDVELNIFNKTNNDYNGDFWQKDNIKFHGEEIITEKFFKKFRLFVYGCEIGDLREIAKKFPHPHFSVIKWPEFDGQGEKETQDFVMSGAA